MLSQPSVTTVAILYMHQSIPATLPLFFKTWMILEFLEYKTSEETRNPNLAFNIEHCKVVEN